MEFLHIVFDARSVRFLFAKAICQTSDSPLVCFWSKLCGLLCVLFCGIKIASASVRCSQDLKCVPLRPVAQFAAMLRMLDCKFCVMKLRIGAAGQYVCEIQIGLKIIWVNGERHLVTDDCVAKSQIEILCDSTKDVSRWMDCGQSLGVCHEFIDDVDYTSELMLKHQIRNSVQHFFRRVHEATIVLRPVAG